MQDRKQFCSPQKLNELFRHLSKFNASPYWKLQLENLARNPAQNSDSKQALLKSRISSSYYELQSPTFGFRSLFKRLLETPTRKSSSKSGSKSGLEAGFAQKQNFEFVLRTPVTNIRFSIAVQATARKRRNSKS